MNESEIRKREFYLFSLSLLLLSKSQTIKIKIKKKIERKKNCNINKINTEFIKQTQVNKYDLKKPQFRSGSIKTKKKAIAYFCNLIDTLKS